MVTGDEGEIVADTSVIGKIILREEGWRRVLEALSDAYIHVVDFQVSEIGNLLWKRKDLSIEEALDRYGEALLFVDEVHGVLEVSEKALRIAREFNLPFYDSAVIALAEKLSIPLFSADRLQAEVGKKLGLKVELFL